MLSHAAVPQAAEHPEQQEGPGPNLQQQPQLASAAAATADAISSLDNVSSRADGAQRPKSSKTVMPILPPWE